MFHWQKCCPWWALSAWYHGRDCGVVVRGSLSRPLQRQVLNKNQWNVLPSSESMDVGANENASLDMQKSKSEREQHSYCSYTFNQKNQNQMLHETSKDILLTKPVKSCIIFCDPLPTCHLSIMRFCTETPAAARTYILSQIADLHPCTRCSTTVQSAAKWLAAEANSRLLWQIAIVTSRMLRMSCGFSGLFWFQTLFCCFSTSTTHNCLTKNLTLPRSPKTWQNRKWGTDSELHAHSFV